jgi:hypothetical protein
MCILQDKLMAEPVQICEFHILVQISTLYDSELRFTRVEALPSWHLIEKFLIKTLYLKINP